MARHWFFGDMASYVFDTGVSETSNLGLAGEESLVIPGQEVFLWDSLTGGNQYTELLDASLNPITSVIAASDGSLPPTKGPDSSTGDITQLYVDAGGPRRLAIATDLGPIVSQNTAAIAGQAAQIALAPVYVYFNTSTASYPARPSVGAPVWWVGPAAPAFGGGFAVDGLDYWIGPVN
jgi:hypothetical protein